MDQAMDSYETVVRTRKSGPPFDLAAIADYRIRSERELTNVDIDKATDLDVVPEGHGIRMDERKRGHPNVFPNTMATQAVKEASGPRRQEKT
jgi:hypothetical protein